MSPALASFGVLLLVIVSIPVVLWLVKRLSQLPQRGEHAALQVEASLPLGVRERIAVVKVGERHLVVGITAQTITMLAELDQALPTPAPAASQGFDSLLKNFQKKGL